ncbi:FAD/NAD-P-binding domain-containing protein [Irpex rosettiformis]|uniref:FAD/NAD-P-binding domain-containing protein n=1 Tax=Irpex rosettiformis TaxID=378272 RepID=A0ACB8TY08_9APHY|nr:FAD/NAD-P-binding domain-containing protein [Irpex rosettiformis]
MYDRLWAPHGLVRYGVAPDHPEVKNCTHKFDAAATDPRFKFFGNVNIASSSEPSPIPHSFNIALSKLLPHYTHLLLASGCTIPNPHPLIPYSSYVIPALSLVHWYTDHPAAAGSPPPPLHKTKHVTVIGNGNVALDVARMLLSTPERLGRYDVPAHVLDVLARSQVRHVSVVGRRGPTQAAFTAKELREMMNLEGTSFVPLDPSMIQQAEEGPKLERQQKRILDLLKKGSAQKPGETEKSWDLSFFRSPVGIQLATDGDNSDYPVTLNLAHTTLSPTNSAVPTGIHSEQPTSLVVTALGHHADPNTPWYDPSTGHVRNEAGQVLDSNGKIVKRVYTSGWAGIGARGVLATTMMNAYSVGDRILSETYPEAFNSDITESASDGIAVLPTEVNVDAVPAEIEKAVQEGKITTYEDWRAIDAEEVRRGQETGKERERLSWDEVNNFLHKSSA